MARDRQIAAFLLQSATAPVGISLETSRATLLPQLSQTPAWILPRPEVKATPQKDVLHFFPVAKGDPRTFPSLLHRLIREAEATKQDHIVRFVGDDAFEVVDRDAFLKVLTPKYFALRNYASFRRQLCMYGFERCLLPSGTVGYQHELFRRSKPEWSHKIRRRK